MSRIIGTLLFSAFSLILFVSATISPDGYKVGDKAENVTLKNINGEMVSFSDYKDAEGLIVIFTCNTCPYAVMYEDRINAIHEKYEPLGFPVIAINPNDPEVKPGDSFEATKVRAEEKNFQFAYLIDEEQTVFPKFGATRTPHVFLLDKNMVVRYIGAIDDNARDEEAVKIKYLEDAITSVKGGQDPDPSFTKAIGCSIKIKS